MFMDVLPTSLSVYMVPTEARKDVRSCGGLNETGPYRLIYSYAWSPDGGAILGKEWEVWSSWRWCVTGGEL